jgi:hypothetical protein
MHNFSISTAVFSYLAFRSLLNIFKSHNTVLQFLFWFDMISVTQILNYGTVVDSTILQQNGHNFVRHNYVHE